LSLPHLVELLSANPARLWGLWPCKGVLQPGADADIVVYDPSPMGTISADDLHHLAGYTPYRGFDVQGRVRTTISRGEIVYRQGGFGARKGRGQFVKRGPFGRAKRAA
jgi:dihydropyrimidinase